MTCRRCSTETLEHGEWLVAGRRPAEAERLLTEAREVFERLSAGRWQEHAVQAAGPRREAEVVG